MMFNITQTTFEGRIKIPDSAKVVFVSDMFVEDYVGGAELTSQALIDAASSEVFKLHSRHVSMNLLQEGMQKFWIFGNFAQIDANLIPAIVTNLRYAILEYDYKYCKFRSPEKHSVETGLPCDCQNQINGKLISTLYYGAQALWWMSEKQKDRYHTMFPFLSERDNIVLSSVFDDRTLGQIKLLRSKTLDRKGWIVLGSSSWIKGAQAAENWCKANNKEYEVVWNLPYEQTLAKLAAAEGFVYLPLGGDTCPRMVIEAKLLGCQLQLNDNVQHKDEEWFASDNLQAIEDYLFAARRIFWEMTKKQMNYQPTTSGYTTTRNCISQNYPLKECIESMLAFCNEVCVVDGGSTDGTWEMLSDWAKQEQKLKLKSIPRDWNHPRFAVFDGMQKAEARKMCTKDFCWQMDCDEVVHEDDVSKIIELTKAMPAQVDIISLPVIEYWGNKNKVRVDIQPWKWRLSRNKSHITHGIPRALRKVDSQGNLCALPGTDGCDMIDADTGEPLVHVSFYTFEAEQVRQGALSGNVAALNAYEQWLNVVTQGLPGVFHYSWYDLARKIRLYRDYWTKHWNSLYDGQLVDTAATNMMFDVPWSDVTDEMIEARAKELGDKLGGWIWHQKWDGTTLTPYVTIKRNQPKFMKINE